MASRRTAARAAGSPPRHRAAPPDRGRLALLVEHLPTPVLLQDARRRVLHLNAAFCELFGLGRAPVEMIGMASDELLALTSHAVAEPAQLRPTNDRIVEAGVACSDRLVMADGRVVERDYLPVVLEDARHGHLWQLREASSADSIREALRAGEARERRNAQRLREVLACADELITCRSIDEVCRRTVELARERLGVERIGLFLRVGDRFQGSYGTNLQGETTSEHELFVSGSRDWQRLWEAAGTGQPRWLVRDGEVAEWVGGRRRILGTSWVASTAVMKGDEPLAILVNDAVRSGTACDPSLQEILALYASLVGHVLARTRQLEQTRLLARLAQRLAVAGGVDELATVIREETAALFGWHAHYLAYRRASEEELRVLGSQAGSGRVTESEPLWQPAAGSPAASCLLSGEPLLVDGDQGESEPWGTGASAHSRLYAPIRGEEGGLGLIFVQSDTPHRYTADDAALLARIADLVGPVLERIQAREALHVQGEHLRRVTDAIPGAVFEVRLGPAPYGARDIFISRGVARLFGLPDAETAPDHLPWRELVVPEDLPRLLASCDQAARSQATWRADFRVVVESEIRWIRGIAHFCGIDEEGASRWSGILLDVTAEKRSEARRKLLATVVEQAGEAIIVTDSEGQIEYVNPAFERVTGYSRDEVIGQPPSLLKSGRHDRQFYRRLWQTIRSGQPWSGQMVNRRKDGSLCTDETIISAVTDEGGRITNYVAVKRDVSHELVMEEQLRQASKMEAIGHLAGGIAHDFNNLLTAIVGYNGMVMEQLGESHPAYEDAAQVHQAAEHAASLTRQLLAFARREMLEPQQVEVGELTSRLEKLLRRLLGSHLELAVTSGHEPLVVQADPGQLEQIVLNLAINAGDAMPEGGRLTITTQGVALTATAATSLSLPPGRYVRLRFHDTGCGMPESVRAHIFEPFFTTKAKGKGTGLGLATVYAIVQQSGGQIECSSRVGEGTTFTVWLPRVEAPALSPASAPDQAAVPARILLVEDERAVRALTSRTLRGLGYQVHEARDAEQALCLAEELRGEFDLLLTDMIMPGMTGRALADRLTAGYPHLRVLFISGYADTEASRLGLDDCRRAFLAKPFTARVLARTIAALLQRA